MDRKGILRITRLIIPLFFIGLALCSPHVSWAEESPLPLSQIVLTDVNGQEFSDGILLDNFEYVNNPDTMGWELIDFWSPYSYVWNCPPSLYLNTVLDSEHGSGSKVKKHFP